MIVIYTAGPYRDPTEIGVARNIERARAVTQQLVDMGLAVVCPHSITGFMSGLVPDAQFIRIGCELLARCDAVFMFGHWERSTGSLIEKQCAETLGIPVVTTVVGLICSITDGLIVQRTPRTQTHETTTRPGTLAEVQRPGRVPPGGRPTTTSVGRS